MSGELNTEFFFMQVRSTLFDGVLRHAQVDGLNRLINAWNSKYKSYDDRWFAYALATAHHETDRKMQPITEYGGDKYFFSRYDIGGTNPVLAKRLGNTLPGDGARFCGRGYVQLTGRSNYADWEKRLKRPLCAQPELALDPQLSAEILLEGMKLGTFTGKRFADYFAGTRADWRGARRIINGTDKAELIASYGLKYYAAISYTT